MPLNDWEDYPSTKTPITAARLNERDRAIQGKVDKTVADAAEQSALLGRRSTTPSTDRVFALASGVTIGTPATTSIITSGVRKWPIQYGTINHDFWSYRGAGGPAQLSASNPDSQCIKFTSTTSGSLLSAETIVETIHYGPVLELVVKGTAGSVLTYVDGLLVSETAVAIPVNAAITYLPVTFATTRARRVSFQLRGITFAGFQIGPQDSATRPTTPRGPRCIVIGDSFTEGSGAAGRSWVRVMADKLGWADTWPSGSGGTGIINPGSVGGRVKLRDRIASDVVARDPDVVIVAMGRNDLTYAAADVKAELKLGLQQIRSGLPDATLVVLSPFWAGGVQTWGNVILPIRAAVKSACDEIGIDLFIDTLETPVEGVTLPSSTLLSNMAVNFTGFQSAVGFPVGSTVEIGTGTGTVERRVITAVSGSLPTVTHTVGAVSQTHAIGDVVRQVGPALFTGSGRVGTPSNNGNGDLWVASDNVHPAQPGHDGIGLYVAKAIEDGLLAA